MSRRTVVRAACWRALSSAGPPAAARQHPGRGLQRGAFPGHAAAEHAAVVGSPTTTAPIMASIRRTRSSGDDGMQVGIAFADGAPLCVNSLANRFQRPACTAFQAWSRLGGDAGIRCLILRKAAGALGHMTSHVYEPN